MPVKSHALGSRATLRKNTRIPWKKLTSPTMSSHSSSRSPVEESFFSTQEDHVSDIPSIETSSTVMVTPNESSNSEYATANQTPMASPDLIRGTAPSTSEKIKDAPGKLGFFYGYFCEALDCRPCFAYVPIIVPLKVLPFPNSWELAR